MREMLTEYNCINMFSISESHCCCCRCHQVYGPTIIPYITDKTELKLSPEQIQEFKEKWEAFQRDLNLE